MNALALFDVLAQLGNRLIGHHQTIQRVDARKRHGRGMRGFARIGDAHFIDRKAGHGDEIDARRMHHHGGLQFVESALARHQLFAIAALFRRSSQIANAARQFGAKLSQR